MLHWLVRPFLFTTHQPRGCQMLLSIGTAHSRLFTMWLNDLNFLKPRPNDLVSCILLALAILDRESSSGTIHECDSLGRLRRHTFQSPTNCD